MREIGSEFWEKYPEMELPATDNIRYFASGRAALDFIINDILCERDVKSALLPSYCCDSMIEPFIRNNIKVKFYSVNSNGIDYDYNNDCDVVLVLDYFGYESDEAVRIASNANQAGKIVIYDSTHKLNGNPSVERWAHYSFCSYRKWFYCNYAVAVKLIGEYAYSPELSDNLDYVLLRDEAASLKNRYINGEALDKSEFLSEFSEAEDMLEKSYLGYVGKPVEFPEKEIIDKRKQNAQYLIDRLSRCKGITLWKSSLGESDVPLFVPVLVSEDLRIGLRQYLISKDIYCPIHWPESEKTGHSDLYEKELSLICDQRYDLSDMERIAEEIENYFKG